jgi:crossover junction endodeoxyribonuclease RuvC
MMVLGIDPGLDTTGYGVVVEENGRLRLVEGGLVRSNKREAIDKRVGSIFAGILEVLEEHKPDVVAMEELYSHYNHPKTAVIMAHARGAILAAASHKTIPVESYPATKIKSALTGNGRARKEQVQKMVALMLGLTMPEQPFDTSDAIAAALCHLNQKAAARIS